MSTSKKVQSSDIMSVSLEIVKEKGIEGVNAREIAKRLGISVQPIFYQFNNMEELKNELLKYCLNYYKKYILEIRGNGPKYKEIGINYIKFAKEESKLFKYIFMGNHHVKIEEFAHFDESYSQVEEILSRYKGFSEDETRKIHLKMWMFTHGIACLIATGTCEFSDEEISNLLTEEFQALTFNSIKSKN